MVTQYSQYGNKIISFNIESRNMVTKYQNVTILLNNSPINHGSHIVLLK